MNQSPIPVKEKEKEAALETVREMTDGGSKGSKSEKQVEGDSDLSWDHEGLEPHLEPSKLKPPRSPKSSRVPRPGAKDEQSPVKVWPKCRGNHMMKIIIQNSYLRKTERSLYLPNQLKKASKQIRVRLRLRKNGNLEKRQCHQKRH